MNKILNKLKDKLVLVFDDNLKTKQWQNIVDYIIISLILLSTFEIFLSTFGSISFKYKGCLHFIDVFTTIIFTIEVTARIWTADRLNKKYAGLKGRLRYCLSFYGLIDVLATYPFYIHFFYPIPYEVLKVLRVARLLRVFRYMKSFRLLVAALKSKKSEMIVSLQFLCIVTIILSFILYFLEHKAQPDAYANGMYSVVWAFAQYIGDPGGFADTPPVTFGGRIIACIIGVLGIAIFAVPAGLIGAGFTEAMEEEEHKNDVKKWNSELYNAFERKMDRSTGYQVVPKFATFQDIQARLGFKEDQIFDAVEASDDFRLVNLSSMRPLGEFSTDILAVEHYPLNKPYGCCIDRNSLVTIVAPSNVVDSVIGHFAFYVAKLGGFNYISRELGQRRPYKSFYVFDSVDDVEHLSEYMKDLTSMTNKKGSWCFTMLAASGAQEPEYPTQFHFGYGGKKGDESFDGEDLLINDIPLFSRIYKEFSEQIETLLGLKCDRQKYHNTSSQRNYARKIDRKINSCIVRVAWSLTCWNSLEIKAAELFAKVLKKHICKAEFVADNEMKIKSVGYDYKL